MFELRAQEVKSHTDKSWIHVNCKIHGTHSPGTADQRKSPGTNQGHIGTSQSGKNKRTTLRIPTWSPTVVLTEPEGA